MDTLQRTVSGVPWTLLLSLGLHGAVLVTAALLVTPRELPPPVIQAIAVDLVPPQALERSPPPPSPPARSMPAEPSTVEPTASDEPTALAQPAPASSDSGDMVEADQFFAGAILRDPANREVRKNFPLLASDEQVVQLCNMEALEQLRLADDGFDADALVGYAFDSLAIDKTMLDAEGGAFRSKGRWFRLRYHCEVSPDVTAVSAFAYAIGDPVPEDQWEEHFLNADDDGLD